jgi:hypothetical protein
MPAPEARRLQTRSTRVAGSTPCPPDPVDLQEMQRPEWQLFTRRHKPWSWTSKRRAEGGNNEWSSPPGCLIPLPVQHAIYLYAASNPCLNLERARQPICPGQRQDVFPDWGARSGAAPAYADRPEATGLSLVCCLAGSRPARQPKRIVSDGCSITNSGGSHSSVE